MKKLPLTRIRPRAFMPKVVAFTKAHKAISVLIALSFVSAVYGSTKGTSPAGVRYVLGSVSRGTVTASVSGTGTVSASNQVDLKAKASGDVVSISAKTGDNVGQGALIVSLDPGDAGLALQSAQVSLQKLTEPSDSATVISARQALTDAENAGTVALGNAFNETAATFLDLPTVIDGMDSLLYTTSGYLSDQSVSAIGTTAASYRTQAGVKFDAAKSEYDALSAQFKQVSPSSATSTLVDLYGKTESVLGDFVEALKETSLAVGYVKDITTSSSDSTGSKINQSAGTAAQTDLSTWTSLVTKHLNSIVAYVNDIQTAPDNIASKQAALDKLLRGADPLDVEAQQIVLEQKRLAYNDYFVTAPFAGVVGRISVKKGDSVSGGSVVATLISKDKVADISLNEVDAAKVHVGDKAILTFDAVDGLTITGTVSDLDLVGTVTQGVVNYNAKITFDTDDPRVLAGMSANAEIITAAKTDVLSVPSSAVKRDAQGSYVLVFAPPLPDTGGSQGVAASVAPQEVPVETGLTSDTEVEITSGLSEGEQIVVRSINPSSVAAQSAPSLFGGGANRAAGGGTRALGR